MNESQLEELLSQPTAAAVQAMATLQGDVLLLGAGGKMGPSLARMVQLAGAEAGFRGRVIAVSRFSQDGLEAALQGHGIETRRGDLLDEAFVRGLPAAQNVIFMTGMKFGTASEPATTWAMNTYVPALVCRRYPHSRSLAFSTGNVYPLVRVDSGGSRERDSPQPVGEYGMSALGRERMFEYFSRLQGTLTTIVRLNYAVELRYGVLVDLARQVLAGTPIDISTGHVNVIWQADASAMALAALADAQSPPLVLNVAGPQLLSVRDTCLQFGELLGREVHLVGTPSDTALLSNSQVACARYGQPRVTPEQLISWTADWLRAGKATWHKPTHFQVRDGRF